MKAILISIKPKYVVDILNGKKTIEIRKTMPKCDLPIDVYIYCTKSNKYHWYLQERYDHSTDETLGCSTPYYTYIKVGRIMTPRLDGKVIAKFTLKEIRLAKYQPYIDEASKRANKLSCLTDEEIDKYLNKKDGYGWVIDDLVIFDKPKELSEFYKRQCPLICMQKDTYYCDKCPNRLTKATQSFCYIEVEE